MLNRGEGREEILGTNTLQDKVEANALLLSEKANIWKEISFLLCRAWPIQLDITLTHYFHLTASVILLQIGGWTFFLDYE